MKRKLIISTVVFVAIIMIGICSFVFYSHSQANSAPLPNSLDVSGSGLTLEGPIQVPGGAFTITFDYSPFNHNSSVTMLSSDMQLLNYKNDPSGAPGELSMAENYTGPIYIQTYGTNWHLTVR